MEARVGVSGHGGVGDGGDRKFLPQQQHQTRQPPIVHQQSKIGTVPQLLVGPIAEAFSKTFIAPLARLTVLFQVQGRHSDVAILSKPSVGRIVNEEGFRSSLNGNLVTLAHRLPFSAVNFYAYEQYKTLLRSILGLNHRDGNANTDVFVHFIGGGFAGIIAASATYPLDLVRTRLAAQRSAIYYCGIWHTLSTICRAEGFFGLYKGLRATLLGVGPSIAISFSVYELLRNLWNSKSFTRCMNFFTPSQSISASSPTRETKKPKII